MQTMINMVAARWKTGLVLGAWILGASAGWSQGLVVFDNRVTGTVVAPVYGVEAITPSLAQHGNSPDGTPPGTQVYSGGLVAGTGFTAQLYGGPATADPRHLYPLYPATFLLSGAGAGFVQAPALAVTVPEVAAGQPAQLQVRVWANRAGTVTNWLQVLADPSLPRGRSAVFQSPSLGGLFLPPVNLIGLESFNLSRDVVSSFDFQINFQPAGVVVPGYLPDNGFPYGQRANGLVYGWNVSHSEQAHAQNETRSPDLRYDTFIQMNSGPAARWEIEVTNGLYVVHLTVGDPRRVEGDYHLDVENVSAVAGTISETNPWLEGFVVVAVTDGRLTITSGSESEAAPLAFVELGRAQPESPTLTAQFPVDGSAFLLQVRGQLGFRYEVEYSTNLLDWVSADSVGPMVGNAIEFLDASFADHPFRFYRARVLVP